MDFPNNDGYGNSPGRRIDFGFQNNDVFRAPANPPPFASTPSVSRAQRPRFAYSGPPNYPRPGSSAAKPNPSSFSDLMRSRYVPIDTISDSMINNYGDSMQEMDVSYQQDRSFLSEYSSNNDSPDSSVYYSCNESFSGSPQKKFPLLGQPYMQQSTVGRPGSFQSTPVSSQKKQFKATSSVSKFKQKPKPYAKPKPPATKSDWRCDLCDIDFTSRVPFAMHFQGQKHAKKLKLKEALKSIQSQVKDVVTIGSLFRCDICGTVANSSFQLQTHLDGLKHKAKVAQLAKEAEEKNNPKEKSNAKEPDADPGEKGDKANQNGKRKKEPKEKNAAVSVLPTDASSIDIQKPPKPPLAAQTPYSCDICDVTLNSESQYQQHIFGKYHKAKVEGKPIPWKRNKQDKVLVEQYKQKLETDTEDKNEQPAAESTTEQMKTTEKTQEPVVDCKQMETTERTQEPAVDCITEPMEQTTKVIEPSKVAKPVVGILKNKKSSSEYSVTGPAKVMGVKPLTSSFVKGDATE